MKSYFLIGADDRIHELPFDKSFSIGRAPINQLVIEDRLVSRVHVRLVYSAKGPVLTDRDSANGTLVNGRVVKECVLASGDSLQIGQHVFFVVAGTRDDAADWVQRRRGSKTDQTITGLNISQIHALDMVGDLATFQLISLLQTFIDQRRQGCLELKDSGQVLGRVYFNNGNIVHADTARLSGKDAFWEIVRITQGQFVFRPEVRPPTFSIMDNSTALILEGCRLIDENPSQLPA